MMIPGYLINGLFSPMRENQSGGVKRGADQSWFPTYIILDGKIYNHNAVLLIHVRCPQTGTTGRVSLA